MSRKADMVEEEEGERERGREEEGWWMGRSRSREGGGTE